MKKRMPFFVFCLVSLIAASIVSAQGFTNHGTNPPPPHREPGHTPPPPVDGYSDRYESAGNQLHTVGGNKVDGYSDRYGSYPPSPPHREPGLNPPPPPVDGYPNRYGFTGPTRTVTVEHIKTYAHKTPVIVTGTIVQSIGGDLYILRDSSGEIILKIGPREWYALGSNISPSDKIEISGELHRDKRDWQRAPEIHVRSIRKI